MDTTSIRHAQSGTMRRDVYEQIAARLLHHVKHQTTDRMESTKTVPVDRYRSRSRWDNEVRKVFKEMPLLVALSCEVKNELDYKAVEIVGVPILITRGKDGVVRTFLNVCRHRGAHVAAPGHGNASHFACPYHGWTYNQSGRLVGVTDAAKFGSGELNCRDLVELFTRESAGLIFTCLTPGCAFDIGTFLGDMYDELASYRLESWSLVAQNIIEGPNWKIAVDGYIEFYHIASLHHETLASMVTNNVMACDRFGRYPFGPHQRIAAPSSDILERLDKPVADWATGEAMLDVKFVFPNNSFAITSGNALSPAGGMLSQVFPGALPETSTTIQNHIYQTMPTNHAEQKMLDAAIERFQYVVTEEDYRGGRQIQLGMNTEANTTFIFGANEVGPQNFHSALDYFLRETESSES